MAAKCIFKRLRSHVARLVLETGGEKRLKRGKAVGCYLGLAGEEVIHANELSYKQERNTPHLPEAPPLPFVPFCTPIEKGGILHNKTQLSLLFRSSAAGSPLGKWEETRIY